MIEISYKPSFVRCVKGLEDRLREEVLEKIELFRHEENHASLKVHKLRGPLSGKWSFSVNYDYRIVFAYESKKEAVLIAFGDHDIYR